MPVARLREMRLYRREKKIVFRNGTRSPLTVPVTRQQMDEISLLLRRNEAWRLLNRYNHCVEVWRRKGEVEANAKR